MIHDELGMAALLEGALDPTTVAAWDEHLVECDHCWTAMSEARCGRARAMQLREHAPAAIRDRISDAVGRTATTAPKKSSRLLIALASIVVMLATIGYGGYQQIGGEREPASVAAVLHLAADSSQAPPPTRDGITVSRIQVQGTDVVLARSDQPFPMPTGAIALGDTDDAPWLARRGDVSLLCYSHPAHVLLAGRASPDRLAEIARTLGFSSP